MNYSNARSLIQSGDLIAYSSTGWVGRIIKLGTLSRYTHVGIALVWRDRVMLMESREGRGVVMRPLSVTGDFTWISHGGVFSQEAFVFWQEKIGHVKYDWTSIWRNVRGKPVERDEFYICCEMAFEILIRCGLIMPESAAQTPGDLVEWTLMSAPKPRIMRVESPAPTLAHKS